MQSILYPLCLALLGGLALYLRASGLDPPSLWLDDQWVGIVVTHMSWGEFFALRPPIPLGFVAILKASNLLVSDPELALQLFPAAAAVAVVPAGAILVTRLTGRQSLGILAGALFAICPNLVAYAAAAKQYSSDCLASILLLAIGLELLDHWTRARALALAGTSLAILLFSFTSLFVAFPLLNLAALAAARRAKKRGESEWPSLAIALGYDAALAAGTILLLSGQANEEMRRYWSAYYMPLDSLNAAWEFATLNFAAFLAGALPGPDLKWLHLALTPCLIALLLVRERTRRLGTFALVFYAQIVVVSAMGLYPLGAGRTDLFSYPITISVICLGLDAIVHRLRDTRIAAGVFLATALMLVSVYAERSHYDFFGGYRDAACRDAELVTALGEVLREDDALLIYPHGSFAVGYYGPWELELRPFAEYAHGFEVRVRRPHTWTLPGYSDYMQRPERLEPSLTKFLADNRDRRIVLFATFATRPAFPWLTRAIQAEGFVPTHSEEAPSGAVITYERR